MEWLWRWLLLTIRMMGNHGLSPFQTFCSTCLSPAVTLVSQQSNHLYHKIQAKYTKKGKTQTQWQIQKQLETPWQNNEYKNAEIQNSYAKLNWNISIAATSVNQKHRTMIKIRNHIAMALWSRLWRLGLQFRRGEPISLPQFLPLTPPPWQTELLGNKLGHIHDGQPDKLSQVGKQMGHIQASAITEWHTEQLGNKMGHMMANRATRQLPSQVCKLWAMKCHILASGQGVTESEGGIC